MPYINRAARLAFLAHPRAASHSIARALQEQAGFKSEGQHHDGRDRIRRLWPESNDWTFFCVVRNPYDALVSWWYKRGKGEYEFGPPWIERLEREMGADRPQGYPILLRPGALWIYADESDVILRHERLGADLDELLGAHGLGPITLPWDVQSTRTEPYQDHYDQTTRDWVADHYGEELRTWGYGWEEPAVR
jgi:hypothetical protein